MREVHGVPNVRRPTAGNKEATAPLRVADSTAGEVRIELDCDWVYLTPEQARFIAAALIASAERVEGHG